VSSKLSSTRPDPLHSSYLLNQRPSSQPVEIMPRGTRAIQPPSLDASSVLSSSATVTCPPRKVHKSLPAMPRTKKDWIGVYLILYNTVTTLLWSYLLVLVFYHLFLTPTPRTALLNPIPQTSTYPTALSFILSHLQKIFSFSTPPSTPPASKAATGVASALEGIAFALVEKARATYTSRGIGIYTAFVQSVAILEVVHALFRWTKSPLVTTIMQVASRLIVVWWIGEGYETARGSPFYASMLIAWCFAEIIRNVYYISSLVGLITPSHYFSHSTLESARHQFTHAVTWLRYTAFYILYPVGAGSEYALIIASFPSFPSGIPTVGGWTKGKSTGIVEGLSGQTTRWIAGWGWATWAKVPLIIIWPASLYALMSYMHTQRRKVFGKGPRLGGKAKVA